MGISSWRAPVSRSRVVRPSEAMSSERHDHVGIEADRRPDRFSHRRGRYVLAAVRVGADPRPTEDGLDASGEVRGHDRTGREQQGPLASEAIDLLGHLVQRSRAG